MYSIDVDRYRGGLNAGCFADHGEASDSREVRASTMEWASLSLSPSDSSSDAGGSSTSSPSTCSSFSSSCWSSCGEEPNN